MRVAVAGGTGAVGARVVVLSIVGIDASPGGYDAGKVVQEQPFDAWLAAEVSETSGPAS